MWGEEEEAAEGELGKGDLRGDLRREEEMRLRRGWGVEPGRMRRGGGVWCVCRWVTKGKDNNLS